MQYEYRRRVDGIGDHSVGDRSVRTSHPTNLLHLYIQTIVLPSAVDLQDEHRVNEGAIEKVHAAGEHAHRVRELGSLIAMGKIISTR